MVIKAIKVGQLPGVIETPICLAGMLISHTVDIMDTFEPFIHRLFSL